MNTQENPKTHPCQVRDPVFWVSLIVFYPESHRIYACCDRIKLEHGTKGTKGWFSIGGV